MGRKEFYCAVILFDYVNMLLQMKQIVITLVA